MLEAPQKLLPLHIGGEVKKPERERTRGLGTPKSQAVSLAHEQFRARSRELIQAPDLEEELKRYEKDVHKVDVPPTLNLSLRFIERFRRYTQDAQDFRTVAETASDPAEREVAQGIVDLRKAQLQEHLSFGKSFEHAYREYIRARRRCREFTETLRKIMALEAKLRQPSFRSLPADAGLSDRAHARIERLLQSEAASACAHRTKKEISGDITHLRKAAEELWNDPMVRYLYNQREIDRLLMQFSAGEDVIETQPVIRMLNTLHEWEEQHQRTTLGGVLVGPPGVGKTTLVRHYLSAKNRGYVYMDLSEDVTRYLLYGSKAIEFRSTSDYYRALISDLERLDDAGFRKFVEENVIHLKTVFGPKAMQKDETTVTFLGQLQETFGKGGEIESGDLAEKCRQMKTKLIGLVERHLRREIAAEVAHIAEKPNGWRDGVIVAALRNGECPILDEFNKCKDLSLIFSLLTAVPADDEEAGAEPGTDDASIRAGHKGWWYFADNREWIRVPKHWRMYFTANIGRKHGGFEVAEALASRTNGKVMDVPHPSPKQEMLVALAALANPEGDLLITKEDLPKLYVLIHDVFPNVRKYMKDKRSAIPISYRTIRDLAEKMILYRNPATGAPVYQPTGKSFDEALYEVLVEGYALYEDKTIPKEIVHQATLVGLFLGDALKDQVLQWMDETTWRERKESHATKKEDFNAISLKIRGLQDFMDAGIPAKRTF